MSRWWGVVEDGGAGSLQRQHLWERIPGRGAASAMAPEPAGEAMPVVTGGSTEGEEAGWMEH